MGGPALRRGIVGLATVGVLAAAALAMGPVAASGEALSPWWGVTSGSQPTSLHTGEPGQIVVTAENRGDVPTNGEVTIADVLPAGLTATAIEGVAGERVGLSRNRGPVNCTLATLTCTFSGTLSPYEQIGVEISVSVKAGISSGEQNAASVSGGGAAGVAIARPVNVSEAPARFGVENYQLIPENADGSVDTRAGSHPFQLTSVVALNTTTPEVGGGPQGVALVKDLSPELPAGLIADPLALARCTTTQFAANECPADTAVGVATVTFDAQAVYGFDTVTAPIFDVEPGLHEPARLGVRVLGVTTMFLEASLRAGGDYGVTLSAEDITQSASLLGIKLTFWGVPGDPRHDGQRGWECLLNYGACTLSEEAYPKPFLSLPSTCGEPLQSTVVGDSWVQAGELGAEGLGEGVGTLPPLASATLPVLQGCNHLPFSPAIEVTPETRQASTPSGFALDIHVPQESGENTEAVASTPVKDITIALPAGVALNPAGADGLQACSEGQVGFEGVKEFSTEPGVSNSMFTPYLPGSIAALAAGDPEPLEPGVNFCPSGAKLGTVKIFTPLIANPLDGFIYLATQNANPFSSLVAVYVVAKDRESGTLVKLPGSVSLNAATGQITVTLQNTPQLPFEDIELHFFGEALAPLATPARCGAYTTTANFVPWSALPASSWEGPNQSPSSPSDEAAETIDSSSTFDITSGPHGSPCPGATLPFSPSLTGGSTNLNAGAFSPLTVTIAREDGQQALRGLQLRLPPGLSAILAGVPLCPEAQANAGTCTASSQLGETTVSAGVGGKPYTLTGGKVYLTGPYNGTGTCTSSSSCAPFGLAIVAPVKAGPLDLEDAPENHPACDCLVIRASIEVNPQTAQLTITTGGIPHIIDGIPLQLKDFNITIDRAGFIFNPTSCNPMSITGTIDGNEGADAPVSSSFHVANCASLRFKPKFTVSTSGKTSELGGASLLVKLTDPPVPGRGSAPEAGTLPGGTQSSGGIGSQANLKAVKIDLPTQLPSRLTTLQQACLAATFDANPAACPPESVIGHVQVTTPILPGASGGVLSGPTYFVSHGGEAFPDIELVLQGDGVKIDLTGTTSISKKRVTSVTFRTIPDVPVSTFTLTLPQGPYSALGTNKNLCKLAGKLTIPNALTGQNGTVIHESTKVSVTGCPPTRKKPRKHKKHA
jgi:uncharacterized repeat protein (TIGR01451 family)